MKSLFNDHTCQDCNDYVALFRLADAISKQDNDCVRKRKSHKKLASAMSSHDVEEEEGTEEGVCPFTVHGITGEEFTKLSMTALKARRSEEHTSELQSP